MAADPLNLERTVRVLEAHCDGFHLDLMDDRFVPNLGLSVDTVNRVSAATTKPVSVHLMVEHPLSILEALKLKKNSLVTVHLESTKQPNDLLQTLRTKGVLAGLALRPKTPVTSVYPHLDHLHHVLVMAVEPGFSGQEFLPSTLEKVEDLAHYKKVRNKKTIIAVDGGINKENILSLSHRGAELFCVGSAIFKAPDSLTALQELYDAVQG